MKINQSILLALAVLLLSGNALGAAKHKGGLNPKAAKELEASGVHKYLGEFSPISSEAVGDRWVKHSFDIDAGNGPICIAGTEYSAFTRKGDPEKVLIMEQGGGACWQDFYNCNVLSEAQEPPAPRDGIWNFGSPLNPFRDYSIVYMPYCDGSIFTGDNDVVDPAFGEAIGVPEVVVRFHRGLRNQSAGMDLAKATFPHAKKITLAGSSAGGAGASSLGPFLVRHVYGNDVDLSVFNDAGPVTINLSQAEDIAFRAADWDFGKFYPESCLNCDDMGQSTAIIQWRLDNDSTIREGIYQTDGDLTNRFFLEPPLGMDQAAFRELIVTEHGILNEAHPRRYKRFIIAGDTTHTALQSILFYLQKANGVPLHRWTKDFVNDSRPSLWRDIVEDAVP